MFKYHITYLSGLSFTHPFYVKKIQNEYKFKVYSSSPKKKFNINSNGKFIFSPMPFKILCRILKYNYGLPLKTLDIKLYNFYLHYTYLNSKIIHANSLFGLGAFKNKLNDKSYKILEEQNSHILFCNEILQKEYSKYNLKFNFSEYLVKRRLEEYRICDKIIVPSSYSINSFKKHNIDESKIIKFMSINQKYLKLKKKNMTDIKKINFGYIGGNVVMKGLDYLLCALNYVSYDFELKMTIDSSNIQKFDFLKNKVKPEKMKFFGSISNMDDFYNQIDILVVPSINDGFAMVVIEAISRCVPVIVSSNVGSSEYINSDLGYVFESGNQDELNSIIEKINREEVNRLLLNIKNNFYSWINDVFDHNDTLLSLYKSV